MLFFLDSFNIILLFNNIDKGVYYYEKNLISVTLYIIMPLPSVIQYGFINTFIRKP